MALKEVGVRLTVENDGGFLRSLTGANRAVSDFGRGAHGAGVGTIALGNALSDLATGALREVTGLLIDAGRAAVGFFADSILMAADLEAQMDGVGAVLGSSNEELEALNGLVIDLGIDPNLKVSSLEAAGAIEILAKNGLEFRDIMDGAARSTVFLANSVGGDFNVAADVMTNTMKIFNVKAQDTIDVVNGISGVVNQSTFDINDYSLALAQGGGAVAGLGVEMDDFNATMVVLSKSFNSGSDAGTSFKTFIQRLVPQSNEATDTMRSLGLYTGLTAKETAKVSEKIEKLDAQIAALDPTSRNYARRLQELTDKKQALTSSLVSGQNAFYDEEGSLRSMAEISAVLQEATSNLSEEQKNAALSTIFGSDALRAALVIADAGPEKFNAVAESLGKMDAEGAAAMRVDNLRGALDILNGVVEGVRLQIGAEFLPILTRLARETSAFVEENSGPIIDFFGRVATGVGTLVDGLLSGQEPMAAFFDALRAGGASEELISNITGIIDKVTGLATAVKTFVVEDGPKLIETIKVMGVVFAGAKIAAAIGGIVTALGLLLTPIGAVTAAIVGVGVAYQTNFGGFKDWVDTNLPGVQQTLTGFVDTGIKWFEKFPTETLPKVMGFISGVSDGFKTVLGPTITSFMGEVGPPFQEMVGGWLAQWDEFKTRAQPVIDEFTKNFREKWNEVGPQITESMIKIGDALGRIVGLFFDTEGSSGAANTALGFLQGTLDLVVGTLDAINLLLQGLAWGLDKVAEALTIAKGLWSQLNDIARLTSPSTPPWLIPGSPPPFAIGLMTIADSLQAANRGLNEMVGSFGQLNQASFAPPASAGQINSQSSIDNSRQLTVNQSNSFGQDMPITPLSELEFVLAGYA